jgi:type I restriction-modification system DNA methylase subunit
MSEELLQRDLFKNPPKIGRWDFYNIGATTIKALKECGIIRNINYGNEEKKKVDALIVQRKNVIAVVEYKKPSEFKTIEQKKKAIKQELEVARKLNAKILIATDTKETIWVNVATGNKIKNENNKELTTNFDPKDEKLPDLFEKITASINEKNDQIKPKELVNPTDLARQIWQDIWSVSGATPENCLYTFVELFIFKYLSDLGVLQGSYSFYSLANNFEVNTADELLETYANGIRPKIKDLFPESHIDKTTIINGTIFVSKDQKAVTGYSTVFKKILLKFRDYGKLENIDYDFKSKLFESFLKESISKKNWGQFFTPLKVVRAIVEMAKDEIKEGINICDPACGVGKFLLEPIITKLDQFYKIKDGKLISKITIHGFDKGFDKDEQKTIILAKANMLIYFSDLIRENAGLTKEFSNLFNESFTLKTNSILGTLSETVVDKYDLILTNPPYVTSGSSNLKDEIKKDGELVNYYKINAMGVEGLFMEWIIRALKPNGKAFIVVPDGIFNRQNDKNLRKFILKECFIDGIISLPEKTFFTTSKKTYILCITKKTNDEQQDTPVFTYLVSEIGESRDIYRFNIEQDDLSKSVISFLQFKGAKQHFRTNDKRCKIQPISKFNPENHWSVERWWSKEEKIKLGIIEEDKTIDISGFIESINDISEIFKEYSSLLKEVAEKEKLVCEFREISLSDNNYFDLFIGKRLLKKDLIHVKGEIPIYSANVKNPISFHYKSNIMDFSNNFVLWGIDGDFEFNYIPKNTPFVTTDHCGTIRILEDDILPEYLMLQLQKVKHKYGFDRGLRSSLKNMQDICIKIPFNEHGVIDVEKQKEVIEKYEYIFEFKTKIENYKEQIDELNIEIN